MTEFAAGDKVQVTHPLYLLYSQPLYHATGTIIGEVSDRLRVELDHPLGGKGMPGGHDHMVELIPAMLKRVR